MSLQNPAHIFHGSSALTAAAARKAAKTVWCPAACDTCASCKAITHGYWADVVHIRSEKHIARQDIEPLFARVMLASVSQPVVAIIYEAERLVPSAAMQLLKTIEEPPQGASIFLTTMDTRALLPTIVSRCLVTACHHNDSVPFEGVIAGEWYNFFSNPCHTRYTYFNALMEQEVPHEHEVRECAKQLAQHWASRALEQTRYIPVARWWLQAARHPIASGSSKIFLRQAYIMNMRLLCSR